MRNLVISKSITNRIYASLDMYFSDINKMKMITPEQEVDLVKKIRDGDAEALNLLTTSNLRFVVSVAKQYQNQGISLGDLINEGNIGLITAAKRYDETKGFKFISYAVWWIRQSIVAAIAEQSRVVHIPYNHLTSLRKLGKAFTRLEQDFGRSPSLEEIADYLNTTVLKVAELYKFSAGKVSIDQPLSTDGEFTLLDVLRGNYLDTANLITDNSLLAEIQNSLKILNQRDRELMVLYFGLGLSASLSLEEIGKKYNLSIEHVRRLKDNALVRLRNSSYAKVLRSYAY